MIRYVWIWGCNIVGGYSWILFELIGNIWVYLGFDQTRIHFTPRTYRLIFGLIQMEIEIYSD